LKALHPPASVFRRDAFDEQALSAPLRRALRLTLAACDFEGCEPIFVARPEIFSHGQSLRWLTDRLGPAREHLGFSDGTTIKLIPGLRNHVFFYGLGRRADRKALDRLERRVPGLFAALDGQVNSARRFGQAAHAPPPIAIEGFAEGGETPRYFRIALNSDSPDDSLFRTMREGALTALPGGFDEMVYVALSETALDDADFVASLAERFDRVYFDRKRALVLRAPETVDVGSTAELRLKACLAELGRNGSRAPFAPAANAWLAVGEPGFDALSAAASAVDLIAHESFDFWRAPSSAYRLFRSCAVWANPATALVGDLKGMLEGMLGVDVDILWSNLASSSQARRSAR
jgi:hypothetical protein